MDIAAMSISMSSAKLQMNVGLAMTRKAMDQQEQTAASLMEMMDAAAPAPPSEHIIDVKA